MKNMVIFLLLIGAFLSETPAMADQNAASQPYVHAVETAYQQAVEKLSADGRKDLQRGQNEWMSFVKQYCDEKNLHWRYKTAEDCVAKYYEQREKQLKNYSITTKEGLVIRHAEYFAAYIEDISDDPDDDRTLWPAEVYISWPQIDNPANEAQRKWNAFMAKGMPNDEKTEGHYCDWQYTYSIPFTTPDFISVVQENWMYCHGAAHGYGGSKGINRILSADRSITSADIFKSSSGWEEALGKLAVEKLTA